MSKYRMEVDRDSIYGSHYTFRFIHKESGEEVFSYCEGWLNYKTRHLCEPELVDRIAKAGDWGYPPRPVVVDVLGRLRGSVEYIVDHDDEYPDLREAFKEQLARIEAAIRRQKYGEKGEEP